MLLNYLETLPSLTLLIFAIITLFAIIIAVVDFIGTNKDYNDCTDKNRASALFGKLIADFLAAGISAAAFLLFLIELSSRFI